MLQGVIIISASLASCQDEALSSIVMNLSLTKINGNFGYACKFPELVVAWLILQALSQSYNLAINHNQQAALSTKNSLAATEILFFQTPL
jgi:hypothetical protein